MIEVYTGKIVQDKANKNKHEIVAIGVGGQVVWCRKAGDRYGARTYQLKVEDLEDINE